MVSMKTSEWRLIVVLVALLALAQATAAQEPTTPAPAETHAEEAHPAEAAHEEAHTETIWGPISRAFNSAVLFGLLYYFLRKPASSYFTQRDGEIRDDLVTAAAMSKAATAQLSELDRKMASLPAELDALRTRGQEEIAAEEARIAQAAAADRDRLLEQTRREIEIQLRIAQRELVEHASTLAVGLATDRIKQGITPEDQGRLVDRYLQQVKP